MAGQVFIRFSIGILLLASLTIADIDDYQCHELYEYDASVKGTVSSPFYGKRLYHNGLWCEYRIRAPEGHRIKVTFKDFDLDPSNGCLRDQLVVYGKDKLSVLGIFCGHEFPRPIISNEGESEIRLLFRTDYMVSGRGFLLEYESGPDLDLCDPGYSKCKNRKCFRNEQKCDDVDDCGDGTDEETCDHPVVLEPAECGSQAIQPKFDFSSSDRMVGGEPSVPNSWPWQVSLHTSYSEPSGHFCGGTLINAQWVLTATHCIVWLTKPGDVKVVLGMHNQYIRSPYQQERYSARVIAYPDREGEEIRNKFSFTHDITLIKLNAPVKFSDGVQPACLPQSGLKVQPGWSCIVTGWGETRGSGNDDVLKQMEQFVQSRANCSYEEQSQICLFKPQNSPCHGDSGGPLQCKVEGKWIVFGAASYGTANNMMTGLCGVPGAMVVYASSAEKVDWIRETINKYS